MRKLIGVLLVLMLSGCLLESVRPVDRNIKPYGAHWIKEGMTRESRLEAWVAWKQLGTDHGFICRSRNPCPFCVREHKGLVSIFRR